MYRNLILFMVILAIIYIVLIYIKGVMLYHPTPALPEKYNKFYQKLLLLTESKNFVTNLFVRTPDNKLLDTIYIKNPDSSKCIIFFHGNAGNISMRFDMIKFLYNYASIIIFDYRSFGRSTGESTNLSSTTLDIDADTIWNFAIKKLNIRATNICLLGESLGCSVAIHLAATLSKKMDPNFYPHSLILNAPFYSLSSMIEIMFEKIGISICGKIFSIFIGREYQSDEWIKYINHQTKIIIAHSPRDEVVPYKEGWNLYNSIKDSHKNAKFLNITGTHNNLGLTDNYIYALADLFND